jgi:hypothetical protein
MSNQHIMANKYAYTLKCIKSLWVYNNECIHACILIIYLGMSVFNGEQVSVKYHIFALRKFTSLSALPFVQHLFLINR